MSQDRPESRRADHAWELTVPSGAARLAVQVRGGGRPVLLVHAGVTDQRSWSHLVERLAPVARCVSYDARGYGRTEYQPEDGWSPVLDAVAVLDAASGDASAEPVVAIGASMGGRTVLDLALAHPERIQALVLIGTAVSGAPSPGPLDEATERLDVAGDAALERGDLDELNRIETELWLDGPGHAGRVGGPARELFEEMNRRALAAPDPGEQASSAPAWDRLAEIAVPALVLVGEHDLAHVRRAARHLARTLPGAELVELAGVAHLPHLEGDPVTLTAIARFVADLRGRHR